MTQGHNVVADGWAGVSNPPLHPHNLTTHRNIHKKYFKLSFFHLSSQSPQMDGETEQPNGRTKPLTELRATEKQVAQGQYVVSDTRCPALHRCNSEWEAGQRPRRGQSPVKHRGTFVHPAWKCWWVAIISWLKAFKSRAIRRDRPDLRPDRQDLRPERPY